MSALLFWSCLGIVFYTYFGYPLFLFLFAKIRTQPKLYQPATPSVTLLIAAYNEETTIAAKIENSIALKYPPEKLQILVVTDGSTDGTADRVKQYANQGVELSHQPLRQGKAAAIKRIITKARGSIVIFSDANNYYSPQALKHMVAPFDDPEVGAVTGAKRIVKGDGHLGDSEGLYWHYESFIRKQETKLGCCTGVNGEILAVRSKLFEPAPSHIINEDFYTALQVMRRGYRIVYAQDAYSYERISVTPQDEFDRRSRIVAGRFQLLAMSHKLLPLQRPLAVWQIISHKFMRPLVPLALIGMLCANILAVVRSVPIGNTSFRHLGIPENRIFLGLQAIFYGLAFLGNQVTFKGKLGKLLYLPSFFVTGNLAALNGFYLFLTGKQTSLWRKVPRH